MSSSPEADRIMEPHFDRLRSEALTERERQGFKAAIAQRDATIERLWALLGDHDGPLWAVRGVREADIRKALEGKAPQ
jgi:hypothetical protein